MDKTGGPDFFKLTVKIDILLCCCFLTTLYGHPLEPLRVEPIEIQPVKSEQLSEQIISIYLHQYQAYCFI